MLSERFAPANRQLEHIMKVGGAPLFLLRKIMVRSLKFLEENEDYRLVQELTLFKTLFIPELENGMRKKVEDTHSLTVCFSNIIQLGINAGEFRLDLNLSQAARVVVGFLNGIAELSIKPGFPKI